MTFIEKLSNLLKDKHLNRKQFSAQINIPYSTIDNWYKRGYENLALSTFKKLCRFFKVSMDSMAYDELDIQPYDPDDPPFYTSQHEQKIIKAYRQADTYDKTSVDRTLKIDQGDASAYDADNSNLSRSPELTGALDQSEQTA